MAVIYYEDFPREQLGHFVVLQRRMLTVWTELLSTQKFFIRVWEKVVDTTSRTRPW